MHTGAIVIPSLLEGQKLALQKSNNLDARGHRRESNIESIERIPYQKLFSIRDSICVCVESY